MLIRTMILGEIRRNVIICTAIILIDKGKRFKETPSSSLKPSLIVFNGIREFVTLYLL